MIRFIFVVIFLITYLILSIPVFFIEWLIGKCNRNARDYSSLRIVQWGFKIILKITGVKVTVIGEENVPDEPVLFIGNHSKFFRYSADILPLQTSDRLCSKRLYGKDSAPLNLDAISLLPVFEP